MIDYFERYGVARPRTNDVRPRGLLAGAVAEMIMASYADREARRLERRARVGADDHDLFEQFRNWELWVRVGHLLQFDPGPFEPL